MTDTQPDNDVGLVEERRQFNVRIRELEQALVKAIELNVWYQKRCNWYQDQIDKDKRCRVCGSKCEAK